MKLKMYLSFRLDDLEEYALTVEAIQVKIFLQDKLIIRTCKFIKSLKKYPIERKVKDDPGGGYLNPGDADFFSAAPKT